LIADIIMSIASAPFRIAFGSCNNQLLDQPLWSVIESRKPTAFVWGGDAVYGDRYINSDSIYFQSLFKEHVCATPEQLEKDYNMLLSNPGYQKLLQTNLTVFGAIDDHDFGCDNGDSTFAYSKLTGKEFVKFTDEPVESPIRKRAENGRGVYGVKVFDFDRPEGAHLVPDEEAAIDPDIVYSDSQTPIYSNKSVAIFVLDVRTNKSPWKKGSDRLAPDYDGDFLGEHQWQWFEKAIARSRASVNIIVSGLQVHPERYPDPEIFESWGKYPLSQQRLYDALLQENVEAPILISGDVHMSQLMRKDCFHQPNNNDEIQSRSILELTTSGMTHSWGTCTNPRPEYHSGWFSYWTYFLSNSFMSFAHFVSPHWTDIVNSHHTYQQEESTNKSYSHSEDLYEFGGAEGATTGKQYSLDLNFGELEFDWEAQTVSMRVLGLDDVALISAKWSLDQLSGRAPMGGSNIAPEDIARSASALARAKSKRSLIDIGAEKSFNNSNEEWICVPYRGHANALSVLAGHIMLFIFALMLSAGPVLVIGLSLYKKFRLEKSIEIQLKSAGPSTK